MTRSPTRQLSRPDPTRPALTHPALPHSTSPFDQMFRKELDAAEAAQQEIADKRSEVRGRLKNLTKGGATGPSMMKLALAAKAAEAKGAEAESKSPSPEKEA